VKTRLIAWCVLLGLALGHGIAHAARSYTYVQSPVPASAVFDFGSTQSLSYQITNTNTAPNTGERIYQMRFRMVGGGTSLFSATTAAPAGWTRTAFTTTSVTFRANSWANAIAVGGSATFTLVMAMRTSTADVSETLRDMRAYYTTTTTGPPFTTLSSLTTNTPGSWTLKSLTITSFQITDTSGAVISSLTAGGSFRLVMTIKNNTTVTQNAIASNPNPPTAVKTGTVTQGLTGTVTSPSPLNLAPGASGTITFTFSTVAGDNGTIYFTAAARVSASVTSASATSPTLTVATCLLSASFTAPAAASCLYPGSNITLTLALTNNCGSPLTTVTPTLSTAGPATLVSGPTPASIASLAVGATAPVNWTYQINSSVATNPFTFTGGATSAAPALTAPAATSPVITRGEFPTVINPLVTDASSTNVELAWTVTNNGCAAAKSVAVTFPAGWVWANDAYSLVNLSAVNPVETWTSSGANPVTFASPDIPNQLPQTFSGDFGLVFSATPASAGTSSFTIGVTDANNITINVPVSVTVNPYNSGAGGLNSVTNKSWREVIP
jgi:hypothetical protein